VYFTTWTGDPSAPHDDIQVGSLTRAEFVAGGDVTPEYGPIVTPPTPLLGNLGTSNGFDSNGDLWMTTAAATTPDDVENVIWRLDGEALGVTDDTQPPTIPLDPEDPMLAETGPESAATPALLGGLGVVVLGVMLVAMSRRQTQGGERYRH